MTPKTTNYYQARYLPFLPITLTRIEHIFEKGRRRRNGNRGDVCLVICWRTHLARVGRVSGSIRHQNVTHAILEKYVGKTLAKVAEQYTAATPRIGRITDKRRGVGAGMRPQFAI